VLFVAAGGPDTIAVFAMRPGGGDSGGYGGSPPREIQRPVRPQLCVSLGQRHVTALITIVPAARPARPRPMTISVARPSAAKVWLAALWKTMKAATRISRVAEVDGR
jgi:hypothetical protein